MSNGKIQVVTGVQRRRRFSPSEKKAMVDETNEPGCSISVVARRNNITPSLLFRWKRMMEDGALTGVGAEEAVVPLSQFRDLQNRLRQLERLLGRKTVEVEILKEAVQLGREKKLISRQPLLGLDDFT